MTNDEIEKLSNKDKTNWDKDAKFIELQYLSYIAGSLQAIAYALNKGDDSWEL
jgi:hypothetical protein